MKNKILLTAALGIVLALTGCATTVSSATVSTASPSTSQTGNSSVQSSAASSSASGTAQESTDSSAPGSSSVSSEQSSSEHSSPEQSSSEAPSSQSSEAPSSSSSASQSSLPEEETYVIVIRSYNGLTITASQTRAKAGETIYLDVTLEAGYLLDHLYVNGSESSVTKISDNQYSFVMPDTSAVITASVSVTGDITIRGTVAAVLVKDEETGIYCAHDVTVRDTAYISYFVGDKELTSVNVDNQKCMADVTFYYGTAQDAELTLAGNAKYDFFYDPANGDKPCYIRRTEVLEGPSSSAALKSLFDGSIGSEPTEYPENIKKVTYTNSSTQDTYEWNNYTDGSLGHSAIVNGESVKDSYVYHQIDDSYANGSRNGEYIVVDNYIEGNGGNGDATRKDDTTAYAGKYDIVDEYTNGYAKYQTLTSDAAFEAHHNSHDMRSLDFDIHYGYRTGFSMEYVKSSEVTVNSEKNEDGSFTTTVSSYKDVDESLATYLGTTDTYRYEYELSLTFTKAGAPLSGTYKETYFDSSKYDVNTETFADGAVGKVTKELSYAYEYGEVTSSISSASFDLSPYFISSLENVQIKNTNASTEEGNYLQQYDLVSDYLTFEYLPETALDSWQYGVVSSDNPDQIHAVSSREPLKWKAYDLGTASVTVANHTTNDVKSVISVEVINTYRVDGFYMQAYNCYYDEEIAAEYAYVRSGCVKRAYLYATSRNTGKYAHGFPCNVTVTSSRPDLLTATMDNENHIVSYDATNANVTETTSVKVTVTSDINEEGYNGATFTIYIMPYSKPTESLFTTWDDSSDYEGVASVSCTLAQYEEGDPSTYSSLTVDGEKYNFEFVYDDESGKIKTTSLGSLDYIEVVYDSTNDQIGIFAVAGSSWDGLDETTTGSAILGSGEDDDEGGYIIDTYYFLDRVE